MAAIAWAAHAIPGVLPGLRFAPSDAGWAWQRMDDLLRCAVALLPATLFWGASFPLALACAGRDHADLGRATGRIYAANTAGAILGALGFSLLAIPWLGTQASQQLLVGITAGAALLILVPRLPRIGRASTPLPGVAAVIAALLLVALGAGLAARSIPALSEGLVTYGRVVADWGIEHDRCRVREGTSATVAVTREAAEGFRSLHVSGKVVASTYPYEMRLQRMLGHLPALLHPSPKSVLVVGFGAGVTAGAFALHPEVERITIVEIEPEVAALAGDFFAAENHRVLEDPRTRIVFDDARHFVATTSETFDVVTSDPIHPWVKGAAALYTREYFELVKRRLNPGGVVTQWVPFYQTSERAVKSEIATFLDAFPHGTIWNTHEAGKGYDVTLMGQDGPARIRAEVIQARLDANPRVRESLHAVGIRSALDLMAAFAGQRSDMDGWLADAELNLDRSLRLEYLAGEAVDLQAEDRIVHAMAGRLSYPQQLFVVNDEQERSLRQSLRANLR
jgi:spermidine synthase